MTFEVREMPVADGGGGGGECDAPDASGGSPGSDVLANNEAERSPFCAFVREDGGKCRAMARRPSEFCFWHEPERLAARRSAHPGGASEAPVFEPCALKTGADVYGLLERATLYAALTPSPDFKRLQTLNVLASTLLRAIHAKELEEEVSALRAELAETNKKYDRCWREAEKERNELRQERHDRSKWFNERNKLRSYLRSTGFDPDSLPETWVVNGRSIFEVPP